jgi:hypothetical protein
MWIEIDLATVPPGVALRDPDDLQSLKVVVRGAEHAYVSADTLRALAGERAADPDWAQQFTAMVDYATSKGWVGDDGALRAHVEAGGPPVTPA